MYAWNQGTEGGHDLYKASYAKKPYIEDALEKYIESEMLDGSNKVDCGECKEFGSQ